jgi:N-acyl-D-amino-acid deacylase
VKSDVEAILPKGRECEAMAQEFDLLIKNGRILDGTGNPYYTADIGVSAGKIRQIRKGIDPARASRVIDARGLTVTPGFFDAHSHDDHYLLADPQCHDKVLQGVTTTVIGNCGLSIGPATEEHRADMVTFFKMAGGKHVKEEDLDVRALGDYLRKIESSRPGINVLPLVGHSIVRIAALGFANRRPTDGELATMKKLVRDSMADGAWGLSTGLIYAPGNYATTEEIIELSRVVGEFGGIYTTHMRNEGDLEIPAIAETIRIGEEAGVPVHISHHKVTGKANWGRSIETLRMMAEARARGVQVTCDQYPYNAGSTFLAAILPPRVLAGGPEVFSEKLKDPKFRAEVIDIVEREKVEGWENMIQGAGFEGIMISVCPGHPEYVGKSIADIAGKENRSPFDVLFDLVVEEKLAVMVILFMMTEEDIQRIMRDPLTMVGTDGIPGFGLEKVHPRMTGTFPRILGRYVREQGVLTLEEAIRKMTSFPAQTFGVRDKGVLKEGFDADIVVFDPETIIDRSTYDDPNQKPEGIHYVVVNGEIAVDHGKLLGATSGRVLRHKG